MSEAKQGSWVAYRDEPSPRGGLRRIYLHREGGTWVSTTTIVESAVRFETRAEALAAAREAWPTRVAGCTKGATCLDA